jgi:hypothetical protein
LGNASFGYQKQAACCRLENYAIESSSIEYSLNKNCVANGKARRKEGRFQSGYSKQLQRKNALGGKDGKDGCYRRVGISRGHRCDRKK